jgi:hypothetical protein
MARLFCPLILWPRQNCTPRMSVFCWANETKTTSVPPRSTSGQRKWGFQESQIQIDEINLRNLLKVAGQSLQMFKKEGKSILWHHQELAVSSHMTIRTHEVAALFERTNLIGMKCFLCTSLEAPLWRICRSSTKSCPHTREKLFTTDILPHKMRNIIIHSRAMFVVDDLAFWWCDVHSTGTSTWCVFYQTLSPSLGRRGWPARLCLTGKTRG